MASSNGGLACRVAIYVLTAVIYFKSPTFVTAQTQNPEEWFCSRWWSQSVVKNDVLFIDSGVQKWLDPGIPWWTIGSNKSTTLGINNWMLTISLEAGWDWKKDIAINEDPKNHTMVAGTIPPSRIRGHMFHGPENTSEVYVYGGTTYLGNTSAPGFVVPDSTTYSLWTYNNGTSDGYPWVQHDISQPEMANHGSGVEAIDLELGFYLNGQIDKGTSSGPFSRFPSDDLYIALPGMLVINLRDFTSENISTSAIRGDAPRVGGGMEYFPGVGGRGVLVALGGQIQPNQTELYANLTEGELLDFRTVDVFDIDSYLKDPSTNGTWYQQETGGSMPAARIDFCTVSISAPDNSSHHIYLYAGRDPTKGIIYDDIYVLSIPSFQWTPIFTDGQSPRWGHNCHVAGKHQMITVGGNTNDGQCDWEAKGVAILDMSTVTWGSVFRPNTTTYTIPQKVLPATGGTTNGAATIKDPTKGWTDAGLETVFKGSLDQAPDQTVIAEGNGKKKNIGAIAGGAVGGVAGLVLIGGALFLWRRKRTSKTHELGDTERQVELPSEKRKYELQGVNENDPAELPGPEVVELNAPREFVEADNDTVPNRAELPGTNIAPGGFAGIPIVRTPGDDLPEPPLYIPGLNRRPSVNSPPAEVPTETQTSGQAQVEQSGTSPPMSDDFSQDVAKRPPPPNDDPNENKTSPSPP